MGRCKSKREATDHEESAGNAGVHEAGKGLEQLAHGGVPNDDDTAPKQALLKMLRVEVVQGTGMRLEHLPVLLLLAQRGSEPLLHCFNYKQMVTVGCSQLCHVRLSIERIMCLNQCLFS